MIKILKNLKQSWLSVLTIVTLLCVQAAVDLELPNYTSKIVNTGIQAGGIEYAVPETVSPDDMDAILLFSNEDEKILEKYSTDNSDGNYVIKDLKENLLMRKDSMGMENNIFRVVIPETKEVEIKDGVKKEKSKLLNGGTKHVSQ